VRAILKQGLLVLVPEDEHEAAQLAEWKKEHEDHAFLLHRSETTALEFGNLGPRADACREPINVVSDSPDPTIRPIGNFSPAPFDLDRERYASVESFWQGLKFPEGPERKRVAEMSGPEAREAGGKRGYGITVSYQGRDIAVGAWEHWRLMRRSCEAKFDQNNEARAALLATGDRPLTHIVRHDSRAIPGVIMADIWMRIRASLRDKL
jgi:predicted NAD-dependent protein-ADP-ribosyltransferase YbiA (DUF1768 family)